MCSEQSSTRWTIFENKAEGWFAPWPHDARDRPVPQTYPLVVKSREDLDRLVADLRDAADRVFGPEATRS